MEQRKEEAVMTEYEQQERDAQQEDAPRSAFWGHSLAAVAVCLSAAAAIALIAILG
jgi:hypothetical protein